MLGSMMHQPLLISTLIRHAESCHGDTEVVSRMPDRSIHRYGYADAARRARQLAHALSRLGLARSDRIGTLAWNTYRHFEIYFAAPGAGFVCHTVNPRLFDDQIIYIINHGEDRCVFFDLTFAALVERIAARCPGVSRWIALCDSAAMPQIDLPGLGCYEELLQSGSADYEWPELDENLPAGLCYTSGTTGNPKGVLYTHRTNLLHTWGTISPDSFNLSARDVVLPVVPMFHANAWGVPYCAAMVGTKLVLPGPHLDGASLFELMEVERVTKSLGVPTVWLGLVKHMDENGLKFSHLRWTGVGGSACPPALMARLEDHYGVEVMHAWGMTETSPVATCCAFKPKHAGWSPADRRRLKLKQGRPLFGVAVEILDDEGKALPHDGKESGELAVKGYWIVERYHGHDKQALTPGGWFRTGDVATIDADGYVQITDRAKDVIKSGGEWIGSIDLENIAVAHPAVMEAAVIAAGHPKWGERPLLVVMKTPGAEVTREELLEFYAGKVAKWWIPDDVVFVEEMPHTATGKLNKLKLRETFATHRLPDA